ncbi:MAG: hypothetical protein ABW001_14130 [Mycobacterium sp.]
MGAGWRRRNDWPSTAESRLPVVDYVAKGEGPWRWYDHVNPGLVATMLELGAQPARAVTALLTWWVLNVRWSAYRAKDVANVGGLLRSGGAVITERDRELAAEAGVPAVAAALDA